MPKRRFVSLVVWGILGFVVGFIIGAFAVQVIGGLGIGGATFNVRVEIFGVTVRQGRGPEAMERVFWTWGVGLLALFALFGAGIGIGLRVAVRRLATALRGRAEDERRRAKQLPQ